MLHHVSKYPNNYLFIILHLQSLINYRNRFTKIIDNSLKKIFFLEILRCSCHLPSCLRLTVVFQNCIFAVTKSLNKYKLKAAGIIWFDQKNQASNEYQIGQVKYIIHLYVVCLMANKNKSMKNTSPGFIFMNLSYSEHHFEK